MSIYREFYTAPYGNDSAEGSRFAPFKTIARAMDAVRTCSDNADGDIIVHVIGKHNLTKPLEFYAQDSGCNGHRIIYRGEENAVISGYIELTDWKREDDSRPIWSAVAHGYRFRQLYADGKRMNMSQILPHEYTATPEAAECGFSYPDEWIKSVRNAYDLEFCFNNPMWEEGRLLVDHVNGNVLVMRQSALKTSASQRHMRYSDPCRIMNGYGFMKANGDWCIDTVRNRVYVYSSVDPNTMEIIAPALEKLVHIRGSYDYPVHNLTWENITFRYGTDFTMHDSEGFNVIQANVRILSNGVWQDPTAVIFAENAYNVSFLNGEFSALGGPALGIGKGCHDFLVEGNRFFDLSNAAVIMGESGVDGAFPARTDVRRHVYSNRIMNNFITDIGVDYPGTPAITVWHATGVEIGHNEICHVPYSAISVGWGWGGLDRDKAHPTIDGKHYVHHNHLHHIMLKMVDGGGVYTLGSLPGTLISSNYIHHQPHDFGCLYYDDGTRWLTMSRNVVHDTVRSVIMKGAQNSLIDNYFQLDSNNMYNPYDNTFTIENNTLVTDGNYPLDIINEAGLEREYVHLLPAEKYADVAAFKEVRTFDGKVFRNTLTDEGHGSYAVNRDGAYLTDVLAAKSGLLIDLGREQLLSDVSIDAVGNGTLAVEVSSDGRVWKRIAVVGGTSVLSGLAQYARDLRVVVLDGEFALRSIEAYTDKAPVRDGKYSSYELSLFSRLDGKIYVGEENAKLVAKGIYSDGAKEVYSGNTVYRSSDESVLTVSADGTVNAFKAGTATVWAEYDGITLELSITTYVDLITAASFATDSPFYHCGDVGKLVSLSATYISGRSVDLGKTELSFTVPNGELEFNGDTFKVLADKGTADITGKFTLDGVSVTATVTVSVLPEGWNCSVIGKGDGKAIFDGEKWTVYSRGENVFSAADDFTFLYRTVNMSDYPNGISVESTIDDIDGELTGITMAGIMLRPEINRDSRNAAIRLQMATRKNYKESPFQVPITIRMKDYEHTALAVAPATLLGARLKITYKDNTLYFYVTDKTTGKTELVHTQTGFEAGETFSIGAFQCSGKEFSLTNASGSDLRVYAE